MATGPATFSENSVLEFAQSNGWYPVDNLIILRAEMSDWYHDRTPVFPVYFEGTHTIYSENDLGAYKAFERWIEDDLIVDRCRTNWLLIYPGTDKSTEKNGYILISQEGTQMTVYNIWGE